MRPLGIRCRCQGSGSAWALTVYEMELGGVWYRLDPAAISAIRYRAIYGESILETLNRGIPPKKLEGKLLRMCHLMIPAADRPGASCLGPTGPAGRGFPGKGSQSTGRTVEPDIELDGPPDEESSEEPFDEYRLLAALTLVGMDLSLLHELPILHVIGVLRRLNMLQDTERKHYRPLTDKEMSNLYPRPKKKAAPRGGADG